MDEKQINTSINFEIFKEVNRNNKNSVRKILKQLDPHLANRPFDTTYQNILVAQFLMNLNPDKFLQLMEKHSIFIADIIKNPDLTKPISQQSTRFYFVYNFMYFSKMSGRNTLFVETEHFSFRGLMKSVITLPSFPILKAFLSKLNYLFNSGNKVRFLEHMEEIHRLIEYAKDFKSLKPKTSSELKYQNSCIYGARFYQLADLEQNCFNSLEIPLKEIYY